MEHLFYYYGDAKNISWVIQSNDSVTEQNREHVNIYKNKISNLQSKYIALHIGLFWGIGVFIIKNEDTIKIKCDDKEIFEHMTSKLKSKDEFIEKRTFFINQLINQRKLKVEFDLIDKSENLAKIKNKCK
ncbi:MAG: hypothetical protein K5790_04430 [Nitrosopumilus sp.]|uniref:hypothetical protein n=1 Tax=Nitrosopumilus sp. TaxID=2024843 RepID=UPI00247E0AF5|nr:hypothetical protein [Nitrosopumilus sp.]MCV0392526.1 hypothetical protein [Nitrosopumilus sp.]